jgi:hypothetical protein
MLEKYPLRNEKDRTMFVFEKAGKVYGHVIQNRTEKSPAKLMFETAKYDSVELLKQDFPSEEPGQE